MPETEGGGENGEQLLNGKRVPFWGDENVPDLDSGAVCSTRNILNVNNGKFHVCVLYYTHKIGPTS